jgi:RHS repeat-associated protein
LDIESFGKFAAGNSESPFITDDKTLYQPPVKTVTWYHTGALLEREGILSQFEHEYFPRWFEDFHPDVVNVLGEFQENVLPEPDLFAANLSAEEWREALRACKGMMLRQEVYELDVDALERDEELPVKLFSTAYHNCHIRRLQPKGINHHAVFLVTESEAITYHYELDLRTELLRPDPRIAHSLNLQLDEYANVLQAVSVVYPRVGQFEDNTLAADAVDLIRRVQRETHLAYSETRYTDDIDEPDNYRLRLACEVLSYELTGIRPEDSTDLISSDPLDNRYFSIDELHRFRLSLVHQNEGEVVAELAYHQLPNRTTPEKRLVEQVRTLFFKDDELVLGEPLTFGKLGGRGLLFETYKLALTEDLLERVFDQKLTSDVRTRLSDASKSGYLSGATLDQRFPGTETEGQFWIRSGIAGFAPDAAQHFYLPEKYTDPFGNVTTVQYDRLDLFVASTTDALGNTSNVIRFDFRVLAPSEMEDINDNLSEVLFDTLGMPTAMAVKGKGDEGDNLVGFDDDLINPDPDKLSQFFTDATFDENSARDWLSNATARHVYYFGETVDQSGTITWGVHPSCACGILRETHVSHLETDEQSLLQTGFEYSDGMGSVVVTKVQAEPEDSGGPIRWIANGKTILNNKGKPVKQFEPYFSPTGHRFEEPLETGVTPAIYYDAVGRVVRTELPDGSFRRVEFSPWHVTSYDQNDTVRDSKWFTEQNSPDPDQPLELDPITGQLVATPKQRNAWLAAQHHNTPSLTIIDSLGRDVVAIAHNRFRNTDGEIINEKYLTFTKLDAEGKPLWIRDARKNLVMQYITPPVPDNQAQDPVASFTPCYDITGNLLFQHSMDAGDRWMINDAAGKPMLAWDSRRHSFLTDYDELHRPVASFVTGPEFDTVNHTVQFEKIVYGDTPNNGLAAPGNLNLRGKAYQYHDSAGIVVSAGRNPTTGADEAFDFKGNLLRSTRQLVKDYKATPDWSQDPDLETEIFGSAIQYDALKRTIQLVAPHSNRNGTTFNVIRPGYNEAKLLERVDVWLERTSEPTTLLDIETATQHIVKDIDYNEKGQRTLIDYGNGVRTTYDYDPLTFRLARLRTNRSTGFPNDAPGGIQNLSYFHDPVGNITRISDEAQQTIFFNGQKVEPSAEYEYDAIYRLVSAKGREHIGQDASPQVDHDDSPRMNLPLPTDSAAMRNYTEEYDYDPVGNILRMIHGGGTTGSWTRRYDHEETNNRLRATSLPGDAEGVFSAKYSYDEHGNMMRMPHLPLMQWDFRNQLQASSTQVFPNGTPEKTWYVYDAAGQRVRKVTDHQADVGVTATRMKERIYLGGFEIYREYEDTGNTVSLERETLHVMDDQRRVAVVETRKDSPDSEKLIRYQFGNHLGSATLELDENAQIISYEEYYPYGSTSFHAVRNQTEVPKRYRYSDKERDEENGLNYHGARYYAPWLGTWSSCDPLLVQDTINVYQFARSNPITFVDLSGQDSIPVPPSPGPDLSGEGYDWVDLGGERDEYGTYWYADESGTVWAWADQQKQWTLITDPRTATKMEDNSKTEANTRREFPWIGRVEQETGKKWEDLSDSAQSYWKMKLGHPEWQVQSNPVLDMTGSIVQESQSTDVQVFQQAIVGTIFGNAMARPRPTTKSGEFNVKEMPNPRLKDEPSIIDSDADYSGLPKRHVNKLTDAGARKTDNFVTFDNEIGATSGQQGDLMKAVNAWLGLDKRGAGIWQSGTHGGPEGNYGGAKQLDPDFVPRDTSAAKNTGTNWNVEPFTNPLPDVYGPGKICVLSWCFSTASLANQRP